jgi:hypothetical protein
MSSAWVACQQNCCEYLRIQPLGSANVLMWWCPEAAGVAPMLLLGVSPAAAVSAAERARAMRAGEAGPVAVLGPDTDGPGLPGLSADGSG